MIAVIFTAIILNFGIMEIQRPGYLLREWRATDCTSLARYANNINIWRNVRDRFPHPYTEEDGRFFIDNIVPQSPGYEFAIVIDGDLTQILRANFHLNPDPSLATSETGMRHRTAARMSVLTDAIVISVSARRAVVNVYVHGKSYEIQPVTTIMSSVNQLVATLQTTRQSLDRSLLRLTALELDDYVTLADITGIFSSFEIMQQAKTELKDCIVKLGNQGKLVQMQLEQLAGSSMDTEYDLMIRDYASDSSEANAEKIRAELARMTPKDLSDPQHVAAVLGYDDLDEDSVMTPLGLRTLSRVSVVRDGVAEKIVDEYGSLQELMDDISEDPERLGDFGVNNPAILADSLYRMKGTKQGNA